MWFISIERVLAARGMDAWSLFQAAPADMLWY
jgi:hypothetical protein